MPQQHPPQPPPWGQPDPEQWRNYGQQPYPGPPPTAPATPSGFWRGKGGAVVLLVGALAVACNMSSNQADSTQRAATSSPRSSATPVAPVAAVPASPARPTPAREVPAAAPAGPTNSFGDGTWVVGEDIAPGTYRSTGAKEGLFELCSVSTHSDENADSGTLLDWKTANANEPVRLSVSGKVKSVEASGCENFVKVK